MHAGCRSYFLSTPPAGPKRCITKFKTQFWSNFLFIYFFFVFFYIFFRWFIHFPNSRTVPWAHRCTPIVIFSRFVYHGLVADNVKNNNKSLITKYDHSKTDERKHETNKLPSTGPLNHPLL